MPGPVFGFLIDRLQHTGKVVEEMGLLLALILGGGLLAGLLALADRRRQIPSKSIVDAAALYLVVGLVLLPLAGWGPLGLGQGITVAVVWALLAAVYGVTLEICAAGLAPSPTSASGPVFSPARRRFVFGLPAAAALLGLGGIAIFKVPGWLTALAGGVGLKPAGPSPFITPANNFYLVSKNFSDPALRAAAWSLMVGGMVEQPHRYSYNEFRGLAATTQITTLECVSNLVGGNLISNGRFSGVPLQQLLAAAHPNAAAAAVNFGSADGFSEGITLEAVMSDPQIMVVHSLDGAPLPDSHGFPARILIPGHYGMRGPKWLTSISVAKSVGGGFWEGQGWNHDAVVKTFSRFDVPQNGQTLKARTPFAVAGVAFAGLRGISAVEWSHNGGASWNGAQLVGTPMRGVWTLWTSSWTAAKQGTYQLKVRARDGQGTLQDPRAQSSYPSGASGYHTINVDVSD